LISAAVALATPNTVTLSVRRTFISLPSRDFTASKKPSTASMVPRIRTVGDCCVHASPGTDITMSAASSTGDIDDEVFGMAASFQGFFPAKGEKHHGLEAIPWSTRRGVPSSHRRGQSVAADADAVGF
jgi:hypothetical protein